MTSLTKISCTPCQGGVPPLSEEESQEFLRQLKNEWHLNHNGHIWREFKFRDFIEAMGFANKITEVAENEKHHPDLHISYGKCIVEIWTHKISGLTENDFILAAKIDHII